MNCYFCDLRFSLDIAYDGTNYSGWQYQPNAPTVQEQMELCLSKILNEKISVVGCGRTDAGVHALNFKLHFNTEGEPGEHFLFRINQVLPKDIAVYNIERVGDRFHARFDAVSRAYLYRVNLRKSPFLSNKSLQLGHKPNLKDMQACCSILMEYNDFASFCKSGADNQTTLCDLMHASWEENGNELTFHIKANRFLRNMVRAIVGTMLEVGNGHRTVEDFRKVIEKKDRRASGKSAAAWGLYLSEISYER